MKTFNEFKVQECEKCEKHSTDDHNMEEEIDGRSGYDGARREDRPIPLKKIPPKTKASVKK